MSRWVLKTRCIRRAHDQPSDDGFGQRRLARVAQAREDQPHEGLHALDQVDLDGGEVVALPVRLQDVVEAHHLHVLGHAAAELVAQRIHDAEGADVVGGEHRIDAALHAEQAERLAIGGIVGIVAGHQHRRRQAALGEHAPHQLFALHRRQRLPHARQEGDAARAIALHQRHRLLDAGALHHPEAIGERSAGGIAGAVVVAIDHVDRHGAVEHAAQDLRADVLGEGDHRIRVVALHVGEQRLVHAEVDAGLEQQRGEALGLQRRGQRVDLLALPRAAHVGHDDADQMRAAGDHRAGGAVGGVVQLLRHAQDHVALGRLDRGVRVEGTRHGDARDVGGAGHHVGCGPPGAAWTLFGQSVRPLSRNCNRVHVQSAARRGTLSSLSARHLA